MSLCALTGGCSFYHRFQHSEDLACHALVNLYCRGPLACRCKIRERESTQEKLPEGTMLPNGCFVGSQPERSV